MRLPNLRPVISLTLVFILAFTSCTKEGTQGPAGPAGPSGPAGPEGNANVQSFTYPIVSGTWSNTGSNWETTISNPSLTADNIQNAVVELYWMQNNYSTPLPFSIAGTDYMFYIATGQVNVVVSKTGSYLNNDPSFYGSVNLKLVIVPHQ